MTAHEVTYRGPSSFAVQAAALIADAPGIQLTSANRGDDPDPAADAAVLVLTLEGTDEAIAAALDVVRSKLPPGATMG